MQLNAITLRMTESTSYFHPPFLDLCWVAVAFLFLTFAPWYLLKDSNFDHSLIETYLVALCVSVMMFSLSCNVQAVMIALRLVNFHSMRRGFFGLTQRLFIITRNALILPIWLAHFETSNDDRLINVLIHPRTFIGACYVVLKCFLQLWLIWDLGASLRAYTLNPKPICSPATPEEVRDDCTICQDRPRAPVKLPCGHIFCYDCIAKWLSTKGTCPVCRAEVCDPEGLEFGDGSVPWITFFSAI
jgi:hypothetical protein